MGRDNEPPAGREAARARAFELVYELQTGASDVPRQLEELAAAARAGQWPEVERACLFGRVVVSWFSHEGDAADALHEFVARCSDDGDLVMTALALVMQSSFGPDAEGPANAAATDADLARAAVLLEHAESGPFERVTAHTACGIAFANRWLWELSDEQYAAGLAVCATDGSPELEIVRIPILYDRAELHVQWSCTLRQLGDEAGIAARRQAWDATRDQAASSSLPPRWARELRALGTVLSAISGEDTAAEAASQLSAPDVGGEARTVGHLKLALALSEAAHGRTGAAASAEDAVASIDALAQPHEYDLALQVAAEVEAAGGHPAGLRYARRLVGERLASRLARLGAMQAHLNAQRLSAEHESFRRAAQLDDLTGAGNRRALDRYLVLLRQRGVERIALVIADLDGFKGVNDRFGHLVGDAALIRVARVAEASVRPDDLVVRLGGDEFAIVLAGVDVGVARRRVERLRRQVDNLIWGEVSEGLHVTVSAGVAAGHLDRIADLRAQADAALYEAKAAGGNQVVCRSLA